MTFVFNIVGVYYVIGGSVDLENAIWGKTKQRKPTLRQKMFHEQKGKLENTL